MSMSAQDEAKENSNDTHQNSCNLKIRYFPWPYISILGVGVEKQINSKFSIIWCLNRTRFLRINFEDRLKVVLSTKPEIRYNFYGRFNNGIFVSKFLEIGQYVFKKEEELNIKDYTYNTGGWFYGVGVMIGRNISLGKKFHIDMYLGPKHRWKNITTVKVVDQIKSEKSKTSSYWGLRIGLNINYTIN